MPALTSLLVWRRGWLAYEQYFHGGSRDTPVNVKSVSKSFLSAIAGIAIAERRGASVDQPVSELLPQHYRKHGGTIFADARERSDSLRRLVTLRHLLTMSSGLAWDESNAMLIYALVLNDDPVRFAAELPVLTPPGSGFNYATASSTLLAGALTRLTREPLRRYGQRKLFGPAGIEIARWDTDPNGVNFGGSEMFMTPREMLKLGVLYVRGGKVGDRQVVPASWVQESLTKKFEVAQPVYRSMIPQSTGYGYLWWLRDAAGHDMACALGLGGQFVLVVPSLDLVIAGTSRLDEANAGNDRPFIQLFEVVDRSIIAAAR
jgi:CubicO group peptidase (beta-lactamase class C family)